MLAFETSRGWKKQIPPAAADKATPELYGLKVLDGGSVRHVHEAVPSPYLSSPHEKYLVENYHATFKPLRSVLPTNGAAIRRQWNTQITQPLVQRPLDHLEVDEVFYRN